MSGTYIPRLIPVILSGGAGTRLWPLSRQIFPKQFQPLTSDHTPFQQTALRLGLPPVVICNEDHRFIVAEQLRHVGIPPQAIVIEPVGRNTAPAAAVAALLHEAEPDTLLVIMPSDHLIRDEAAFRNAVEAAVPVAAENRLVTFGIIPDSPATGFGYIGRGEKLTPGAFAIERFVEKPDHATAQAYLDDGGYYWNSGIFMFSPKAFLAELTRQRPDIEQACRAALGKAQTDLAFHRLDHESFAAIDGTSIDYAVMESARDGAVVPVEMGWSDIGSWRSLARECPVDSQGNGMVGDILAIDTKNCHIRGDKRLIATLGVENLLIVDTEDALLVADATRDQDVKTVVETLISQGRKEAREPVVTYRPWGWFRTIDEGEHYRVKQIMVHPGGTLSLQRHRFRSEHWVVVVGVAKVTCGEKIFMLNPNESTFIPAGIAHRLENPGPDPLTIIEVQSGEYVGEDDIVRLDDVYGRQDNAAEGSP